MGVKRLGAPLTQAFDFLITFSIEKQNYRLLEL
jgi:hypothetical protein